MIDDPYAGYDMPGGNFAKWETPGQSITMQINSISKARKFDDEDTDAPQWNGVDADGNEVSVSVKPMNLLAQALTLKPQIGAWIQIDFLGVDGNRKLFKLQELNTTSPGPQNITPAPASPPPAQPAPNVPPVA